MNKIMIVPDSIDSLRIYVTHNYLRNRVLYPKHRNVFKNVYNYIFKRYGTLNVIKHDSLWIFNIHSQGKCVMSVCCNSNFTKLDMVYRNIRTRLPLQFHNDRREGEFKVARGELKDQLFGMFIRMLNNL